MKNKINLDNRTKQFPSLTKPRIYLDNGATTKVDERVLDEMLMFFTKKFGNPSSLHSFGAEAEAAIKKSRAAIAKAINADDPEEIIFTGSATEADNLAIKGIALANRARNDNKDHIITTRIEHSAVLNPCRFLEREGFSVTYLDVDEEGIIDIEQLKKAITKRTLLVSVIHSNHEVGVIQDLESIGRICREKNVFFHTDAAQSFTKTGLDVQKFNLDLVALNAHKIHGPKGIGVLYVKKGVSLQAQMLGGPQEYGLRAGTENVPYIAGFAKAAGIGLAEMEQNIRDMTALRDRMIEELLKIPDTKLNGPHGGGRICNNVNISFSFVEGEAMMMHLDMMGIAVSTGSACSSKSLRPSHVLTAMGRTPVEAHGSLRFTLSKYTTQEEVDYTIKNVRKVVESLRKLSPLTHLEG